MEDIVRVIRIIEYKGPRDRIERQVANSVHGTREFGNGCTITAVTLGTYPEILVDRLATETAEAGGPTSSPSPPPLSSERPRFEGEMVNGWRWTNGDWRRIFPSSAVQPNKEPTRG